MNNLKLIAAVRPGETINIERKLCEAHNSWMTYLFRTENRKTLCAWLERTLEFETESLENLTRKIDPEKRGNRSVNGLTALRNELEEDILKALTGVRNLIITYSNVWGDDITPDLQRIIQETEKRLHYLKRREFTHIVPITPRNVHDLYDNESREYGTSAESVLNRYLAK